MCEGKTILITGAASGLGAAWTRGFLNDGAKVIAADIDDAGLAKMAEEGAMTIHTDVSKEADVEAMIEFAMTETGQIDVLFNNAGIGYNRPFLAVPKGNFEQHMAVHVFGTVYGMRYVLPHMQRQGHGRIVNTISRAAEIGAGSNAAYAAAKAAIWSTSRSVAAEMVDTDILINMLIPGPTNTAIWGKDMPKMQGAEVTYPTAKMLATFAAGGPQGKVFWDEKEYPMFNAGLLKDKLI